MAAIVLRILVATGVIAVGVMLWCFYVWRSTIVIESIVEATLTPGDDGRQLEAAARLARTKGADAWIIAILTGPVVTESLLHDYRDSSFASFGSLTGLRNGIACQGILLNLQDNASVPVLLAITSRLNDVHSEGFSYSKTKWGKTVSVGGNTLPMKDLAQRTLVRILKKDFGYDVGKWIEAILVHGNLVVPKGDERALFPTPGPDHRVYYTGAFPAPANGVAYTNCMGMRFVEIPAGAFVMGSPSTEPLRSEDELQHHVRITHPFWIGEVPVTQVQWQALMGANRNKHRSPALPAEAVTWDEACEFCRRMAAMDGREYRLPTEAEWEYCSRATDPKDYHVSEHRAGECTEPVGVNRPNRLGVYNFDGSIREWCFDLYQTHFPQCVREPTGPRDGERRVAKGAYMGAFRPAARFALDPKVDQAGFRVVFELKPSCTETHARPIEHETSR